MSALVGGALGVAALVTPAAGDEMVWIDHDGNATTCEGGQMPAQGADGQPIGGEDITDLVTYEGGQANVDDYVTITSFPDGWTLTGVVVKGGDGYRVYFDLVEQMTAPDNNGGQVPTISHWFVCAEKKATTPPPTTTPPDDDTPPPDDDTPPPTTPPTTPPDGDESPEPSESPSTEAPETPKPSESTTPPPGDTLPDTGANTGLLGLGAVLLLGGAALAGRSAFLTR